MSHHAARKAAIQAALGETATTTTTTDLKTTVKDTYRVLARLIDRLPNEKQRASSKQQLREGYQRHANATIEQVHDLIHEAGERIAYLRIITPKDRYRDAREQSGGRRWVYRSSNGNGGPEENGKATVRVNAAVSNWNETNMDPDSVKRHYSGLKRAGFKNNLHAKGIF
mmetsp:Transcript_4964/g.7664  ORF Transcript_4964/g.7664 Transcript_4964/m.7664 type:complete len:169 (-) Transcript_4964:250-756(-)